jgi:hypothetical protein
MFYGRQASRKQLTNEDHVELARLLNQAQDNLDAAARIVGRAAYTDRTLYVGGTLQQWLIDPLIEAWRELQNWEDWPHPVPPYQMVGHLSPFHRIKKPPSRPAYRVLKS